MTLLPLSSHRLRVILLAGTCALSLLACSDQNDKLRRDLEPPAHASFMSPPVAPDPNDVPADMRVARARGLKTNVYFNEELQQAVARLQGMEETLGRLQSDLQGTAMAMQRVEMMRQEVDALNLKLQSIQERLVYAGPMLAPAPQDEAAIEIAPADPHTAPVALIGARAQGSSEDSVSGQISKPVMDENGSAHSSAKPAAKSGAKDVKPAAIPGKGVVGVRFGTHDDRVRIVLDVNGLSKYTTNLDNKEKLLTVDLPESAWSADLSALAAKNPLVASYSAQASGKGSVVGFALKGDTRLIDTKLLKGTGGAPSRLVIDLAQ